MQPAIEAGLLPPAAAGDPSLDTARPWSVTLLTALGAWLAAVPLLVFAGLLLGALFTRGIGPYLVGGAAAVLALRQLRGGARSAFVEQLAVPILMVGFGALGFGLFRDLPDGLAAALMAAAVLASSAVVAAGWQRVGLGAASAVLGAMAIVMASHQGQWLDIGRHSAPIWAAWHGLGLLWLVGLWVQTHRLTSPQALWLEQVGSGWVLAVTAALAWLSGMTFLAGGVLGGRDTAAGMVTELAMRSGFLHQPAQALVSAVCAGVAAVVLTRRWPALRRVSMGVLALVAVGLAAAMSSLGAALLIAALCAATGRPRLAAAAALASAWIIGAFYYAVQLPLATKSLALLLAGAVTGGVAWHLRAPGTARAPTAAPSRRGGARAALVPLGAVAIVALSTGTVWQKERLLAVGRPAFVELAPVDPRSLMQGDYMTLAWQMPQALREELDRLQTTERPRVAARRDERQVLTLTRLIDAARPLAAGEEPVELSPKDGRWVIVTDAWFFREGEADRWQSARYGEFRLLPDGRALLVGLRGADLRPL